MRCVRGAAVAALALGLSAWAPYGVAAPLPAAEPVDLGGQPVDSSTDSSAPTPLDAGLWSVELAPGTQTQYFSYDRRIADSSVHIGVVGAPASVASDGVDLAAHVPNPDSPEPTGCGEDYASTSSPPTLVGAAVLVGNESEGDPCLTAGTITIEVARYSTDSNDDLPVAIKIVEEAPVSDAGAPLAETEDLSYDVPDPVEPTAGFTGEPSFDAAPEVYERGAPVTVAAEITQGTELLWRVSLDWGDQLVVRGDLPAVSEAPLLNTGVQLHLVQPGRDVFALAKSEDYTYGSYLEEPPDRLVVATYPLRYANRDRDLEPTLPGDYWLGVFVDPPAEGEEPVAAPVELTFAVTHTDAAAPVYQRAVLGQGNVDAPADYAADAPFLVGDGEFAAVASGSPVGPKGNDDVGSGDAWWGPRRAVGLGVGVASLGCCIAGALWLRARRSATSR